MVTMNRLITGREALQQIDAVVARARANLSAATQDADETERRHAELRTEQLAAYRQLADLRIGRLSSGLAGALSDASVLDFERQAARLLESHETFTLEAREKMDAGALELDALEKARAEMAKRIDEAVGAYEERVSETHEKLAGEDTYKSLVDAYKNAAAIAERAESKLAVAESDLAEKGAPYLSDPLFFYLWKRGYKTTAYKAGPLVRALDGWVARLCGYDAARLNYARLTDLPKWLEEHAARTHQVLQSAQTALEEAETVALEANGAQSLKLVADGLRSELAALDERIVKAETHHHTLAQSHDAALRSLTGPAAQARSLLEDALKSASQVDLRVLASQTVELDDDHLVDQLVTLRNEDAEIERKRLTMEARPEALRRDLSNVEALRRGFKQSSYDSVYALFPSTIVEQLASAVLLGRDEPNDALQKLGRAMQQRRPAVDPGFGGPSRRGTLGLPDILGDIAVEIAKEAMRQQGGVGARPRNPWGSRPTRGRSANRFPTAPKGGQRGGGFKTGGGF